MKLLVIDNYDSFTYNLVQYLRELEPTSIDVFRNDQIALEAIDAYDAIVLSPGPGLPEEAGLLLDIIRMYSGRKPILGICLGHQAIGQVFGGQLHNLSKVYHGLATPIELLQQEGIFAGQNSPLTVGRYHSWVVDTQELPVCLEVLAQDAQGQIMAFKHQEHPTWGLQFHPESVLTPTGKALLNNFLKLAQNFYATLVS
ncbi:MAG: aminodeoxychorismate/anthranilate synthase component II [Aureispira sp.]